MPTERSPMSSNSNSQSSLQHYDSEPNLSTKTLDHVQNITQRSKKRLRLEHDGDLANTKTLENIMSSQDSKLDTMMSFMQDMKQQMSDVQKSVDFMSSKYDEMFVRFGALQEEHKADRKKIMILEQKIENMERYNRVTTVEIKNIPTKKGENNKDLFEVVKKTASLIDVPLLESDVKNVFRVNTNDPAMKPIITEFTTVFKKDEIVNAVKDFNKKNQEKKLSTTLLSLEGPEKPVFVSECLTFKNRKLYAMGREYAKVNNWKFCWTSRGSVFLRKAEGLPRVRINDEEDFKNLKK